MAAASRSYPVSDGRPPRGFLDTELSLHSEREPCICQGVKWQMLQIACDLRCPWRPPSASRRPVCVAAELHHTINLHIGRPFHFHFPDFLRSLQHFKLTNFSPPQYLKTSLPFSIPPATSFASGDKFASALIPSSSLLVVPARRQVSVHQQSQAIPKAIV